MKTLDEACATFMTTAEDIPKLVEMLADRKSVFRDAEHPDNKEMNDRWDSILEDIAKNEKVSMLMVQMMIKFSDDASYELQDLLLEAFTRGVMIGMEMEKP